MRGRFSVTAGFILLVCTLWCFDREGILPHILAAAALHEFAHLVVLRLCGAKVRSLRLTFSGAVIEIAPFPAVSYQREAAAALAGAAVNIAAAFATSLIGGPVMFLFAGVSFSLGLFNLLPAGCLDGGRVLSSLLYLRFTEQTVQKVLFISSLVTGLLLTAAGIWILWLTGYNLMFVAAGVFVLIAALTGRQ